MYPDFSINVEAEQRALAAADTIVAVDDPLAGLKLVELAREHFPHMKIVARARNVTHYMELKERGVSSVERESFESALRAGRLSLESLGVSPYEARERADRFRLHNLAILEALMPHLHDENKRLSMAKAAREQLAQQFEQDRLALEELEAPEWHSEN